MSNKLNFALLSLVAAIPAAALAAVMVMAFLSLAGEMPMMMMVLAGVTLLASATVALIPIGIFVAGGKAPSAKKKDKKSKKAKEAAAVADDEEADVVDDELVDEVGFEDDIVEADEFDVPENASARTEQIDVMDDMDDFEPDVKPEAVSDADFEMFFDEEDEKK